MFKKLATFIMIFVVAGSTLAFAKDHKDRRVGDQQRREVVVPQVAPQDQQPRGDHRTAEEWKRFLFDYHYCDKGFTCGGAE